MLSFESFHILILALGFLWSLLTFYFLFAPGATRYLKPYTPFIFAALLAGSLSLVTRAILGVEHFSQGLKILDADLFYRAHDMQAFAQALGPVGRQHYALFQLSFDTLAPPAFACFVWSVSYQLLTGRLLNWNRCLIGIYFVSVLLANSLMPLWMLTYPNVQTPVFVFLLYLIPLLDALKYSMHILAWLTILVAVVKRLFLRG